MRVLTFCVETRILEGMTTQLKDEIRQTKPFGSLEQEAHLSIERTAAVLTHAMAEALKEHGVTSTQYNVLRILRGAGPQGLCRGEVRDRLVAQVPDVTRLLDRLEAAGLVARERGTDDRRYVTTRVTPQGLRLLERLDEPVGALHRDLLGHLEPDELNTLIALLARVRTR
jgi:DNA-binding MarR family transcriptional regulator